MDRCRFLGYRRDLMDIIQVTDFMVLPSLSEGLPNVLLESFSCRKPVVATSVGGVPELVTHNKNGLIVDPANAKVLAEAIKKIYASEELRKKFGDFGYTTVKNEFSFEQQNLELEKIYRTILNISSG